MDVLRSVFIGGIELSATVLASLVDVDEGLNAVFCPDPDSAALNDDYVRLGKYVDKAAYHEYKDINGIETIEKIASYNPDIIYVLGVSQILKSDLLDLPVVGCLGGHISLLPANRGCNPIIWAIANGLTQHGVTMIWLDEGIDTGDIAAQRPFHIHPNEHAGDIYKKVATLYVEMLETELLPQFRQGIFPRRPQSGGPSNYWRRRSPVDGRIDWRMSAQRIHNLVRALYYPYPGADAVLNKNTYKVWATEKQTASEVRIPGEVLDVDGTDLLVKAGENAVWLRVHDLPVDKIEVGTFLPQV